MRLPKPGTDAWDDWQVLVARLAGIRASAGLTGTALSELCGWGSSRVSRIERAYTLPSADDIRAWCRYCGAPGQAGDLLAALRSVEEMSAAHRAARQARPGPADVQPPVLPPWERTTIFRAYASWIMPGAVQTDDYAVSVMRLLAAPQDVPDGIGVSSEARAARLRLLREGDHQFHLVLEERVLRRVIGGPGVMTAQLSSLIALMLLPAVTLGIIPHDLERRAAKPAEDFQVLDQSQVTTGLVSGGLPVTQPSEIARYTQSFSDLSALAVDGKRARTLITGAIESLG